MIKLYIYTSSIGGLITCIILLICFFDKYNLVAILLCIVLLLISILSNYFNWDKGYVIAGTLLLILLAILISVNGKNYQAAS